MNHAPPFQDGGASSADPLVFAVLGALAVTAVLGMLYLWWMYRRQGTLLPEEEMAMEEEQYEGVRVDRIGLSKRAEDVLKVVMETPMLQNELPDELEVSKATVSNAVSELFDRGLVKKKKKANTYLIEPKMDEIREKAR